MRYWNGCGSTGTGGRKSDEVPVFSNEAGEPLKTFKKAWQVAVLKAHGVSPEWRKGSYKDLTPDGQERLRNINLHWHDLRHEYASRLVEKGVPLAQVRDLLGHASIVTTERYDNQRLEALQAAVARLEDGKVFDAVKEATENLSRRSSMVPAAKAEVSRIFQVPAEPSVGDDSVSSKEIGRSN